MKRIVIGTAGHIDHGKTTLVRALTGIDTDRLKEEKQRGISIELGFAHFRLPSGQKAAIVDVPGHERFIRHMLAGAFGVDMVLLVIAADEGIMPQTREHIDIIELLGIKKGLIVITKTDMVDEEWLMLVEEEIREYMEGTILKTAPVIPISALKGVGLEDLIVQIEKMAQTVEEKPAFGQARLPIDRIFSVSGFGTVVTGTLWSGQLQVGDNLELMPGQKIVKIRNLQVHNEKVSTALAGQRVAVNLQGVDMQDIKRGYLLTTPGFLAPTYRVDTRLRLLSSSSRVLKNWNRIRFHLGTEEALGRIVLLDLDEMRPGEETYAQIVLEKPIVAYKGDPFVIRYYSPVTTIGGGTIIDPNASKQKRFKEEVLNELVIKEEGTLYDVLLQELENNPAMVVSLESLIKKTGAESNIVKTELLQIIEDEKAVLLKEPDYISKLYLQNIKGRIIESLEEFHRNYPLRPGYSKEDMRSRFFKNIDSKTFNHILKYWEDQGALISKNNQLMLAEFKPIPGEKQQEIIDAVMDCFTKEPFMPPSLEEIKSQIIYDEQGFQEILAYLLNNGELVKINAELYFSKTALEKGRDILTGYFAKVPELTLAQARDIFDSSRKYMLPLLEYYDRTRFTRRQGDTRVKNN